MMNRSPRFTSILFALLLSVSAVVAQQPAAKQQQPTADPSATSGKNAAKVAPAGLLPVVLGEGTPGTITKWTGSGIVNTIGNSVMIEDGAGRIGIGTATPTSKLTVRGMIETTLGGYKFPDGTVQTSAFSAGQVVSSLNNLKGDVTIAAGANITITPSGKTLIIAAPNSLTSISHDATITGNGTSGSPLGVAIPVNLIGSGPDSILNVRHTDGGTGVAVEGSVRVKASDFSVPGFASFAVQAIGGKASAGSGGDGVSAAGGEGLNAGEGVRTVGGNSSGAIGGNGVNARGGDSTNLGVGGFGGHGVTTIGGLGIGAGRSGGIGIIANGGLSQDGATRGDAGQFIGNVEVTGNLSKGGGSFKIDHPLDPENKYLYHSFVESPDMKNIYDGVVKLDANGEAVVELPEWFQALNRDYRYLLTAIGAPAPTLFIAEEVRNNRFKIAGGFPGLKVSWQVTGIRQDAFANKNRIQIEEEKTERERGTFLHPEAFAQPEERAVEWARHPELMRQMKETRLKQMEEMKQKAQSPNR
jgi:hypothetical protein